MTGDRPRRVKCKRGQPKPPNTVLVRRPYRYGNPFDWHIHGHDRAIELHAEWTVSPDSEPIRCGKITYHPTTLNQLRDDLGGFDLGCNCEPGLPCHADTLLELANR